MLYSESFVNFIKSFDSNDFFDQTVYNGLDRKWFNDIGTKIFSTMLISIFNPSLMYLLNMFILRWLKNKKAAKAKTMKDYIEHKTPLYFDIERRFAFLLNIFFISVMLSSGIPILITLTSFALGLMFLIEKKVFITFTKKPPMYTGIIMSLITKILPWASFFSVGISIHVLGNSLIFPVDQTNSTLDTIIVSS